MKYIIVKHAGSSWEYHFDEDPQAGNGVHISHSAAFTHTGKNLNIQETYSDKDTADNDCILLNERNPVGNYAVCRLLAE
jgi:hypothetical protein